MNLMKLANPVHVAHEVAGLAGTVAGAAGTVVGRAVGAGREVLHRAAPAVEEATGPVGPGAPDQLAAARSRQAEPRLPGADTAVFPPQPPAEQPVDVVGEALSGQEGPVTEGGAVVEIPDPQQTAD